MRKTLGLVAILTLAAAAHAESYDGVHQGPGLLARDDVAAQAVAAAHAPDQNVTHGSRGADPFTSTISREAMRQVAVAAAHAPDQNVTSGSRVNSVVVSTMPPVRSAIGEAPASRF
ncbi:hypothetical protein [Variovorax sp. EL159]|uniref:hypothetical protein n=1 Tax=Variovorax sp. EL159 TaxID=1566270 RepID=UPI00088379DD|nr:hypothetical protein [Variovorax sp. EL159]SCX72702.1 hypothetical protein SAMN03159363_4426 [Variovorax sp. EL159]